MGEHEPPGPWPNPGYKDVDRIARGDEDGNAVNKALIEELQAEAAADTDRGADAIAGEVEAERDQGVNHEDERHLEPDSNESSS